MGDGSLGGFRGCGGAEGVGGVGGNGAGSCFTCVTTVASVEKARSWSANSLCTASKKPPSESFTTTSSITTWPRTSTVAFKANPSSVTEMSASVGAGSRPESQASVAALN